ncbi:MAG: pre-peptidase C-terminal domain-containing protein, partial [Planctomycetes bacterium]|nr:pre-peptidase C-terminal domain-containing protein [Planctomycetota bacterium]
MRLSALCLSSLALSPALLAQTRVAELEPNNSNAAAQAIAVGDQIDGSLAAAGDQDWYSFTLAANGRVRIHTSNSDTRIALLDGTGTIYRAIDDDARGVNNGFSSELQLNLSAGNYMVQVVGYLGTATGPYSLEVSSIDPVVYDGNEIEPNDTHLTATPTGVLGAGTKKYHGSLGANTVVFTGTVDVPAVPPVVYSSACVPLSNIWTGTVNTTPASTTTVTQSASAVVLPAANPLPTALTPGMNITMTSGVNVGLARLISATTVSSITSGAFPVANAGGDGFSIDTVNTTTITWVASLPVSNMFVGNLGYSMVMTSGANVGLIRTISGCTGPSSFGSAITTAAWPVANAPGDTFDVICTGSNQAVRVVGAPLTANAWNPTTGGSTLGHFHIRFTSGANAGLTRQIRSNTAASITTETTLTAVPAAGDTFEVEMADADYYQVVLTAPLTSVWFQINEGDDSFLYGHRYEIYDASGNALLPATSTFAPAFGTQNGLANTLVARTSQTRVWPAGTYYIAVRNAPTPFTAATGMAGGVVPAGNYMFELATQPMNTGAAGAEVEAIGVQVNNTQATAEPIVPGDTISGNLSGTDTSD